MNSKLSRRVSSLNSVATLQTKTKTARPMERYQLANRYARLECELARIEREITIWNGCSCAAQRRLNMVRTEINQILPQLNDAQPNMTSSRHLSRTQQIRPQAAATKSRAKKITTFKLEY
jgi:hypothetical protein